MFLNIPSKGRDWHRKEETRNEEREKEDRVVCSMIQRRYLINGWTNKQINQINEKAMSLNICNEVIHSSGGV